MPIEFDNKAHLDDFVRLNEQWISEHFSIEEADQKLAADPYKIVRDGGHIISLVEEGRVVGVCALFKDGKTSFELARMAVDPAERGKGYSNLLILVPAALVRLGKSLLLRNAARSGNPRQPESDFINLPGPLNSAMIAYYRLEARILQRARLPFGLSVVCVAQRPYESEEDGRNS